MNVFGFMEFNITDQEGVQRKINIYEGEIKFFHSAGGDMTHIGTRNGGFIVDHTYDEVCAMFDDGWRAALDK